MNRKKPPELRRSAQLLTNVTPSQKERITAAAREREMVTSEFVRATILAEVEKIERTQAKREKASK